ncbi:hypothetical protein [Flyfo microvirus Tbat2_160]|nr:hypothetical protein [Flyfo microvirus Tbat2_160]
MPLSIDLVTKLKWQKIYFETPLPWPPKGGKDRKELNEICNDTQLCSSSPSRHPQVSLQPFTRFEDDL